MIDTHAHLEEVEDLDAAVAAARQAGVTAVITMGSDDVSNHAALEIATKFPGLVYPALGLHPSRLADTDVERTLQFIADNIDRAVAIGEIGLDYHKRVRAQADRERQQGVLRQLLRIAREYRKPVSLHSRYAWHDAMRLVVEAQVEKAVFHWYTGTSGVLREIIGQGFFLSITPAVTYHEEHRRTARETPLAQLLLETDCPVTYGRGRDFEFISRPSDAAISLKGIAEIKGLSEAEVAAATSDNARKLFHL